MFLNRSLDVIERENLISFHMPGHKNGRLLERKMTLNLRRDITEIPGADNLHAPESCIAELERAISVFYKTECSKILINGSTSGILAMILGTLNTEETLLINRNAHQSVYHASVLGNLKVKYLYPEVQEKMQVVTGFSLVHLKQMIQENPDIKACVLTYPTYEGICYPIEEMIDYLREKDIRVLVDAAHGAHLVLDDANQCILNKKADVVIHSFHKTLPAMTQTAALHFGIDNRLSEIQKERIMWHLKALQTSSPSYVLMSSIDAMMDLLIEKGRTETRKVKAFVTTFYNRVQNLKTLTCTSLPHQEWGKIVISVDSQLRNQGVDGCEIASVLRETYGIQCEFALDNYLLLMASICNEEADFLALEQALLALDERYSKGFKEQVAEGFSCETHYYGVRKSHMRIKEAVNAPYEWIPVESALNRVCGEFIIPYPPGIPLLVPGEFIDEKTMPYLQSSKEKIKVLRCSYE